MLGALLRRRCSAPAPAAGVGRQLLARRCARRAADRCVLTVLVNVLVSRERPDRVRAARRLGPARAGQPDASRRSSTALVIALRLLVVTLACLLVVCAVDPDELLRALRGVSPRSALTATLATRLIPVLGADARRLAEAQRCRPDGGAARRRASGWRVLRATVAGALDRSLDVAAALEMRGYGSRAPARPRASRAPCVAPRPRLRRSPRWPSSRWRSSRALTPARRRSTPTRCVHAAARRRRSCSLRAARRALALAAVPRPPGDRAVSVLALRARHLPLPGRGRAGAAATSASRSSRASSACSPASPARASRRCCAPPAGSCRTSTAASFAGTRRASAGLDTREHGPAAIGALAGTRASRTPRRRS